MAQLETEAAQSKPAARTAFVKAGQMAGNQGGGAAGDKANKDEIALDDDDDDEDEEDGEEDGDVKATGQGADADGNKAKKAKKFGGWMAGFQIAKIDSLSTTLNQVLRKRPCQRKSLAGCSPRLKRRRRSERLHRRKALDLSL
jgi:hypothetical protein